MSTPEEIKQQVSELKQQVNAMKGIMNGWNHLISAGSLTVTERFEIGSSGADPALHAKGTARVGGPLSVGRLENLLEELTLSLKADDSFREMVKGDQGDQAED